MKRNYYGIGYSQFSMGDSAEKIREWNTADVMAFDSKAERDGWAAESAYHVPCTASFARKCGGAKE